MRAPEALQAALDRMCTPLDSSRLSGVTAQEDARCMQVIRDAIGAMLAERERLIELINEASAARWSCADEDGDCPDCGGEGDHDPSCLLGSLDAVLDGIAPPYDTARPA